MPVPPLASRFLDDRHARTAILRAVSRSMPRWRSLRLTLRRESCYPDAMSIHKLVLEMKKMLGNLDRCFEKAVAHADAKKFDVNVLVQARLAPDMLPLSFQVQAACDLAKFAASRSAGKQPPSHPDTEQTMDDLRKRIATVSSYFDTFGAADFEGVDTRTVSLPRWEGKSMTATDYVIEHAMPNFFFHVTTAYDILRHNGVDLGKRDFIGHLSMK
jgi:hypothetical protein